MIHFRNRKIGVILLVALFLLIGGCSTVGKRGQPAGAPLVPDELMTLVEYLYMNSQALAAAHSDLKDATGGLVLAPDDRLLSHLQKIALYVQKAQESSHYQWELLSIGDYIRAEAASDYYTLRLKSLHHAAVETSWDIQFIELYSTAIDHPKILEIIAEALATLEATGELYRRLQIQVQPLSNADGLPQTIFQ